MDTTKAFTELSAEEQVDYVKELKAQVEHKDDEHKTAMEDEKKNHESALKAMEEEKKKEGMEEEKKKHEGQEEKDKKLEAAILKAMEEEDKDKRESAIRSAMEEHKDDQKHEGKSAQDEKKDDEEKKAMRAEITYLNAERNEKKIKHLESIYKAAHTPEETLKEYKAEWEKMTPKQLDAAVEHIKPLISTLELSANTPEPEGNPFGWSSPSAPAELSASVGDKAFKKIDDMSDTELFTPGVN